MRATAAADTDSVFLQGVLALMTEPQKKDNCFHGLVAIAMEDQTQTKRRNSANDYSVARVLHDYCDDDH